MKEIYIEEILRLCREEGLEADRKKISNSLANYTNEEIERMLDAFYRFGVKDILSSL